jgi:hypothetical protein
MTTEMQSKEVDKGRKRMASGISGGIFLISLGVLLYTRGQTLRGIGTLAFFCAIPIGIWIIQETEIPWTLVGPLVLIGIGVIVLVKTLFLRE